MGFQIDFDDVARSWGLAEAGITASGVGTVSGPRRVVVYWLLEAETEPKVHPRMRGGEVVGERDRQGMPRGRISISFECDRVHIDEPDLRSRRMRSSIGALA